jgi:hypothetical protein
MVVARQGADAVGRAPVPALVRGWSPPAWVRLATLLLALGAMTSPVVAAPAQTSSEYDLKAAFLFNFAQFVEWPPQAFIDASSPITIAILGVDPFGASLDEIVAHETAHNRPIVVRRYHSVEEVEHCQILFISQSKSRELKYIASKLEHRSILTVGETKDFAAHSGIIGFEVNQRRLRLRINLAAANATGLTISSKLLRQATIVSPGGADQ